ncbi:MAG: hypothetical protein R3B70_05295 [Polyangiaceae bacterium]
MDKADLAALLSAHGGRAQPVASLHVLRADRLSAAGHAFLAEHREELATLDLSRWLGQASGAQRPEVIDALAQLARRDPGRFEFEIARAPHFELEQAERAELIEKLRGRAPETLLSALSGAGSAGANGGAAGAGGAGEASSGLLAPGAGGEMFNPSDLLGDLDLDLGAVGDTGASTGVAGGGGEGLGDLLSDPELFGDGGLGDGDGFAFLDEAGATESANPSGRSGAPLSGLSALLAELSEARTPRLKGAWKKKAAALAADPSEDWSAEVTRLPKAMSAAAELRARSSPRPEERAALLEWLFQSGAKKTTVVLLTLELLGSTQAAEGVRQWLAQSFLPRLLSDKASWNRHGPAVLAALIIGAGLARWMSCSPRRCRARARSGRGCSRCRPGASRGPCARRSSGRCRR